MLNEYAFTSSRFLKAENKLVRLLPFVYINPEIMTKKVTTIQINVNDTFLENVKSASRSSTRLKLIRGLPNYRRIERRMSPRRERRRRTKTARHCFLWRGGPRAPAAFRTVRARR